VVLLIRVLLISGATFLLSGTILFGLVYLSISNYVPHMTGWSDPPGKFSLALDAIMARTPYIISILLMIIGSILLITALSKELSKTINQMQIDNKEIEVKAEEHM
jgi:hypothetical protein